MKHIIFTLATIFIFFSNNAQAVGKQPCLDPISTVDWRFFFDNLDIGTWGDGYSNPFCACKDANYPDGGIKLRFFEPIGFTETVNIPGYFPCFQKSSPSIAKQKKRGGAYKPSNIDNGVGTYRNGHFIFYPIFSVLNLFMDKLCVSRGSVALPFIGELEPQWFSDFTAASMRPDLALYGNPIAQASCVADCVASVARKPMDAMYWCNGCWDSAQNLSGRPAGRNEIRESAVLSVRMLQWMAMTARMRQTETLNSQPPFLDAGASAEKIACGKPEYFPLLVKHAFALQPAYPVTSSSVRLGQNVLKWGNFKNVPNYPDRIFTVWRSRFCCIGIVHLIESVLTGGSY